MSIFVTGATGFIGSHFVPLAISQGFNVYALRRSLGSTPKLKWDEEPKWVTKSIDQLDIDDFNKIETVVHLAAHSANVPYDTLDACMYWNCTAPLRAFGKAADAGVRKFVVAGSCFEYGKSGERYDFIPPYAPLEPNMSYPASKAAMSIGLRAFAAERKSCITVHRIFQVFGEGEPEGRLWPMLRNAAKCGDDISLTEGEQVRDFIHVTDVVEALLATVRNNLAEPGFARITNLGSGKATTVREFVEFWWNHWNATGKLRFGEIPYRDNEVMRYVPMLYDGPDGAIY
jgi:nucleoside-diphosphate-sugar epimerase